MLKQVFSKQQDFKIVSGLCLPYNNLSLSLCLTLLLLRQLLCPNRYQCFSLQLSLDNSHKIALHRRHKYQILVKQKFQISSLRRLKLQFLTHNKISVKFLSSGQQINQLEFLNLANQIYRQLQ